MAGHFQSALLSKISLPDPSAGDAVIYDNRMGLPEDINTADPQAIANGCNVIHK
jgi:hypothetical protein